MQDPRLFVQSLARGLGVLRAFGATGTPPGLPQIAAATEITKSAAQRFASTLLELGYLRQDASTRRYSLTPRMVELGYGYLRADPFVERASPYALDLSRRCSETVNLSAAVDVEIVYLTRFASAHRMPVFTSICRRLPMYCCSTGRAYLSALPRDTVRDLLERSRLQRRTSTTVVDVSRLLELVDEAREAGWAMANGEYHEGDLGVAVAVRDAAGRPVGVINIVAPSLRQTLPRMRRKLVPMQLDTARLVANEPPPPNEIEPFALRPGRERSSPLAGQGYAPPAVPTRKMRSPTSKCPAPSNTEVAAWLPISG